MSGEFQSRCFDVQCAYLAELEILSKQRSYTLILSGLGTSVKKIARLPYIYEYSQPRQFS